MTLQPDTARIQDAVFQAEESLTTWKELSDELQTINVEDRAFQGRSMSKEIFAELQQKQAARRRRKAYLEAQMKAWETNEEHRMKELDELRIDVVTGNLKGFAPLMMMALGILCFFIALLCFVTSSQPRSVWISTLVAVLVAAFALPLDAYLYKWSPRKSTARLLIRILLPPTVKRRRRRMDSDDPDKTEVASEAVFKV
jgi:hypothetical protein